MTMTIQRARRGSWGTGWEVYAGTLPRRVYLGYSRREAEARYRAEYGLQRRRLEKLVLD